MASRRVLSVITEVFNFQASPLTTCGSFTCRHGLDAFSQFAATSSNAFRASPLSHLSRRYCSSTDYYGAARSHVRGLWQHNCHTEVGDCHHISSMQPRRGYKFYTPHLIQVVPLPRKPVKLAMRQRLVGQAAQNLQKAVNEARMDEGWRSKRFYVKPKKARKLIVHKGFLKQKRKAFNTRLSWALKSMARGL